MSWGVLPWVYPVWYSLGFLELGGYFLPYFREVFSYYFLEYFLMAFLFVFFFWDFYDLNIGFLNVQNLYHILKNKDLKSSVEVRLFEIKYLKNKNKNPEFRIMIIKMIQNLENKMELHFPNNCSISRDSWAY